MRAIVSVRFEENVPECLSTGSKFYWNHTPSQHKRYEMLLMLSTPVAHLTLMNTSLNTSSPPDSGEHLVEHISSKP